MVRIHYLCEKRFYDLTDKLGLLVFAEIPFWQVPAQVIADREVVDNAREQLKAMIREIKNHPSVVIWSVGNESASDTERGRQTLGELMEFVRQLDSTRPVSYVSSKGLRCRCHDLTDVICFNEYYGRELDELESLLEGIHQRYPHKSILVTELGWEAVRGITAKIEGGEECQAEIIKKHWNLVSSKPYVLGGIVWSFADYYHQPRQLGSAYLNPIMFFHGVLDIRRRPKKSYQVLKDLFANSE